MLSEASEVDIDMQGGLTRRWDLLLLGGFVVALALARAGLVAERDPYWQIRAGTENLAGVPLARPDTWTWSGVGGDWYPNSPLWNVMLGGSYQLGGFWGFFTFSCAALLLLMGLLALLAARLGSRPLPGLIALFAVYAGAVPYLGARATLGAQILMLVAVLAGLELSDRAGRLPLAGLASATSGVALVLSVLGNWIHLSFLLVGPALAAVWAVVWVLTPELAGRQRVLLISSGALGWLLGPVLSPYGLAGGLQRARAVQDACQGLLTEWSSPFAPSAGGQFTAMVVSAVLMAAASAWWLLRKWRRREDVRLLAALALIGVPATLAGLVAVRFLGIGPVTLAPAVAAVATHVIDRFRLRLGRRQGRLGTAVGRYTKGRFWRLVLTIVLVAVLPAAVMLAAQHGVPPERAVVERLPTGCRVFSAPDISAVVVLLRPDAPVWMDGRADFFGRDMLVRGIGYYTGTGEALVPPSSGCVLLDPTKVLTAGLRAGLASSPDWHLELTERGFELWLPAAVGH